jgi:hypothetical protein
MGLWSVLFEIVKAVAPHAAPHVTKAVVNAAKDRMGTRTAGEIVAPSNEDLASLLASLERRVTAAETRAAAAEQELETTQNEFARKWKGASLWVIALLAWNAVLTGLLIYLAVARR